MTGSSGTPWDHTDAAGIRAPERTVLGADLGEVFFESTKHRRSEGSSASPSTVAPALAGARQLFAVRSAPAEVGVERPQPPVAHLLHDAGRDVLAGGLSPGVEVFLVTGAAVFRTIPGTTRCDPALPLSPGRREAFREALDIGDDAAVSAIVVVAYPERLVLAAREAGVSCPPARAYRRTLVEAGAVIEAVTRRLTGSGLEVEPRLHVLDDRLNGALALDGVAEVAVAALVVGSRGDGEL